MAKDIQYKYAIEDHSERVVNISSLTKEHSKDHKYYCPDCRNEMYPTFGKKYEHHFRHNCDTCQRLNYLHTTAELLFLEEYTRCLNNGDPFLLEVHSRIGCDRNCTERKNRLCLAFKDTVIVDLTKIYTNIKREYRVLVGDHFRRPDILLTNYEGDELWIEIWVTHETDEAKRMDGHIVELKVYNEKDLEQISNHKLIKTVDNELAVRLFNVKLNERGIIAQETHNPDTCPSFKPVISRYNTYYIPQIKPAAKKPAVSTNIPQNDIDIDSIEWIDLGLPSGTLWAKEDYETGVDFETAFYGYRKHLPSTPDTEELLLCKREWDDVMHTLRVTGPNGNHISFKIKDDHITYWLNRFEEWGKFGQCVHIFQDRRIIPNDMSCDKPGNIRFVKRQSMTNRAQRQLTLFDD